MKRNPWSSLTTTVTTYLPYNRSSSSRLLCLVAQQLYYVACCDWCARSSDQHWPGVTRRVLKSCSFLFLEKNLNKSANTLIRTAFFYSCSCFEKDKTQLSALIRFLYNGPFHWNLPLTPSPPSFFLTQETFEAGLEAFEQESISKITGLKDQLVEAKHVQSDAIIERHGALMNRYVTNHVFVDRLAWACDGYWWKWRVYMSWGYVQIICIFHSSW